MRIYGGIITYQPDLFRLTENIKAIKNQVEKLVIIDNGSDNQDEMVSLCKKYFAKVDIFASEGVHFLL